MRLTPISNLMAKPSFLPPFMFELLFATFGVILSAKYSSITVDKYALLALKSHITHDPHNFLGTNWSTSTSVCSWIGVTCGSRHYRVTALNLSSMDLAGTISSQLGNLSFLAWLDIHQNSFHGSLPIELTNLRRMKYLDFGNNSFNGEIPSWFGCFSKLQRLYLYLNNFIGVIPSTLGNLSKLEALSLGGNQISGRIPNNLLKCKELKFLSLLNNYLKESIPTEIGNLTLLDTLVLHDNHFKERMLGNLSINLISEEGIGEENLSDICPYIPGSVMNNWTTEEIPVIFRTNSEMVEQDEKQILTHKESVEVVSLRDKQEKKEVTIKACITAKTKRDLIKLLKEFKDVFAWLYQDMPGLSTDILLHRLPINEDYKPIQ
ncbi:leucine-rich repeat receptor-like serine/threonine-protein kinase BAM2 [Gossypium australe]|uniref:Leucine-rich repeat receptor-like serine/threonine-protein kinase BAM2 n=1 Tax=Gossypium australe TaxID=47621 RepID=A0A5B6VTK7_9ROSI|nr:leucine-rich repeat receptor-like serine/threonine-protein kinase BAM2 [Gossypium australe]